MIFKGMKKLRRQIVAGLTLAIALGAPAVKAEEGQDNTGLQQVSAESVQAGALPELPARHKWTLGSEIDALPFAMNGYYGSGFMGRNGWKLRYVVARSTTPAFMVTDGFKDKRTDAYALLADRFVGARRQTLEGFWIGGGGEYWRNRIRTDASPSHANYHNVMLTFGGGYVWKLSRHFYLNPWAAGHVAVAGERNILVSGKTYKQPAFTPEGSVKLGIRF